MTAKDKLPPDIMRHLDAHLKLYMTDPVKAHMWDSSVIGLSGLVPTLMLCTTGRKSGQERCVTLQYFDHGHACVVIGSKGGLPNHPAWVLNLQANPQCRVQIGARSINARARFTQGQERETLWDRISDEQPAYKRYAKRTERTIPVIILDPVE